VTAAGPTTPRCTYRVQLHEGFTVDDAAAIVGDLDRLGVSHLYCSPVLQACAGSTHGYDVVDHSRLSSALGGAAAFGRLTAALDRAGMGLVVDIVPNHMARDGRDNRWWWDVLAHGPSSRWAPYFDIDWRSADPKSSWTVLVPILGDHYGRVLEAGELQVARDAGGGFVVNYHDHELPLAPGTVDPNLDDAGLGALNGDPDALDEVLTRQHYRLAHWRTASEELDYRRFFNIDTLVALRVEDEAVLADTHEVVLGLLADGTLDGLRVDHVDGLRDPEGYLHRLRQLTGPGTRIVVEKILARDEPLPPTWPVQGTTGYEFAALVDGVLVDAGAEDAMTALYRRRTGEDRSFEEVAYRAKHEVMGTELSAEVAGLTRLLAEVCTHHRRHRDHTRRDLRHALRELLACFGTYRTYAQPGRATSALDGRVVDDAVAAARQRRPDLDAELLAFVGEVLLLRHPGAAAAELAARFPQVSAPVMAKGVEDTAFYRYHRLVSLNEVGGDPGTFGRSPEELHTALAALAVSHPGAMLARSTHDTKRAADVRARIHLLAELTEEWDAAVQRWAELAAPHRDDAVDAPTEYLLAQTVLGAWPGCAGDGTVDASFVDRVVAFAAKATREAKVHTSWSDPDADYDAAVERYVRGMLGDPGWVGAVQGFLDEHRIVERGRVNSLAGMALLLTAPGVPDLYQGGQVWDLSLVDPDNRRPVDHARIARLLDDVAGADPGAVAGRAAEGAPLLWLVHRVLEHRRHRPDAYLGAPWEPLAISGAAADHVVAATRGDVVTVVPRLPVGLDRRGGWADTSVRLPAGSWRDLLGGAAVGGGDVAAADLLASFPVAVLAREGSR
jgi:(1->4)-alpha-D-glucan 1-alpha-D-glucosylmutase